MPDRRKMMTREKMDISDHQVGAGCETKHKKRKKESFRRDASKKVIKSNKICKKIC
jgi:hypothetical protein